MPSVSEKTEIGLPIKNLLGLLGAVATFVWAYFGIVERLNTIETQLLIMGQETELNSEFRVRWPRGELGSLPADAEQFMLLNHLDTQLEKLITEVESGSAPFDQQQELTLQWYAQRISELESQVEELRARR